MGSNTSEQPYTMHAGNKKSTAPPATNKV